VKISLLHPCFFAVSLWLGINICSATDESELRAGAFNPPRTAPDFTLDGSHGKALELSEFRGKVVVLGFGFTSCPDVCPTTLAVLAQARKRLGALAEDVQVIYITVDPERDNPEQMRRYLATFDSTFLGGTASAERLAAVRKEYGIAAEKKVYGNSYSVAHSSYTYFIDREGRLRALMPYGRTPDDYAHDVRILLKQ
jgi:protein SCO1/2